MEKNTSDKRKYLKIAIIAVLIVFLLSIALLLLEGWDKRHGWYHGTHEVDDRTLSYNGQVYVPKDNIETFLVMGLDKVKGESSYDSYDNDEQADFLMLFVFDNDAKKCSAIHINRDTMADMNVLGVAGNRVDTVTKQIALAHTYGKGGDISCRNTANAVEGLLSNLKALDRTEPLKDVKVNHYISLAMDSVAIMNDLVGGVEVTVLEDFTGFDSSLVKGETVVLNGEQALHYVRTRYGLEDSSNSTRMERQQQYINSWYDKYSQCVAEDDEFIIEASLAISDYIVSDRSATQLRVLARKFSEYEYNGIINIEGTLELGEQFMEFYPDDDSLLKIVVEEFYKPQ